jgi:hypothetical protein
MTLLLIDSPECITLCVDSSRLHGWVCTVGRECDVSCRSGCWSYGPISSSRCFSRYVHSFSLQSSFRHSVRSILRWTTNPSPSKWIVTCLGVDSHHHRSLSCLWSPQFHHHLASLFEIFTQIRNSQLTLTQYFSR